MPGCAAKEKTAPLLDGSRFVVQGDSITQASDSASGPLFRSSWPMLVAAGSNGDVRLLANAAHGGFSSAELSPLFDVEVLAHEPTLIGLMPGRNDAQVGGSVEELAAYVTSAVAEARERGTDVFLVNTVPEGAAELVEPEVRGVAFRDPQAAGLTAGLHEYLVTAGNGTAAAMRGETTPGDPLSIMVQAGETVQLSWDAVPGASWYRVYEKAIDGSLGLIMEVPPSNSPGFFNRSRVVLDAEQELGSGPPTTNTTAIPVRDVDKRLRINAWLEEFAEQEDLVLVDVYSLLADADGRWRPGYTFDGTHPTAAANRVIADAVLEALDGRLIDQPHTGGEDLSKLPFTVDVAPRELADVVTVDAATITSRDSVYVELVSSPVDSVAGSVLQFTVNSNMARSGGLCGIRLIDPDGIVVVEHAYAGVDLQGRVSQPFDYQGEVRLDIRLSGSGVCGFDDVSIVPQSP